MSRGRDLAGWLGAGMASAGLFAGMAVAAFRMPDAPLGTAPVEAVALDLSVGVVAMAEAVPSVPPPVPQTVHTPPPETPVTEAAPLAPAVEPAPDSLPEAESAAAPQIAPQLAGTLPVAEAAPIADAPPPPPERREAALDLADSPRPRMRPAPPRREAQAEVAKEVQKSEPEPPEETPPQERAQAQASQAQAAGAQQAAQPAQKRREAGGREAARYGDLVMRQIARQRRASAPGRGVVTVGFEVDTDGGLRRVAIVASSGSEALDQVAVDHIRRAAPFPPPPEGATTRFAFEFVGK